MDKRTLSFNKNLYPVAVVRAALRDYAEAARFRVSETDRAVRVTISGLPAKALDELAGEFCNYALVKMKGA